MLNPTLKNRPQHPRKGRPRVPGSGRKKGTLNSGPKKRVVAALIREANEKARERNKNAKDISPLEFMLEVLHNPDEYPFAARQWAAEKAAPYVHRKMPISVDGGGDGQPIRVIDATKLAAMTAGELETLVAALEKLGAVTSD